MTDHESQAVPYVLGELADGEAASFEMHLATCAECSAMVAEMSEGLVDLAFAAAEDPPESLRSPTLDAAADLPQVAALSRRRRPFVGVLMVAAAVAVVLLGGIFVINRPDQVERILASDEARTLGAAPTEAYEGGPAVVEVVYLEDSGDAVLVIDGLAAAPEGTTYEAWFIGGDGPRPAGLFDAGRGREVFLLDAAFAPGESIGITIEPAGGSEQPTGAILFIGSQA